MTVEQPDLDPLLAEIETAIALGGVSQTAFGYAAVGDPALVGRMRKGQHVVKAHRREKIQAVVDRLMKEGRL